MIRALLFWTLLLSACSLNVASPQPIPPSPTAIIIPAVTTVVSPVTVTVETPPSDQPPTEVLTPAPGITPIGEITPEQPESQSCGYQWAYGELPELAGSFQQSIQALEPGTQTRVYAFGENCVLPDGTVGKFLAMETDFEVTLQVSDITDKSTLGEWIVKVMQVIDAIPPEQISGPRPGRVSIRFESSAGQDGVNFYIDQYNSLPAGLSNLEIYQTLHTP